LLLLSGKPFRDNPPTKPANKRFTDLAIAVEKADAFQTAPCVITHSAFDEFEQLAFERFPGGLVKAAVGSSSLLGSIEPLSGSFIHKQKLVSPQVASGKFRIFSIGV
jgi:hypothetical protein